MTVSIIYAGTSDGYMTSSHASSYGTALAGSALVADTAATTIRVGQSGDATTGSTTKTYNCSWTASWYGFGKRDTQRLYQGNSELGDGTGYQYGKIGFPYSTIESDLAGSSITKVELRMSNEHFWYNDGGTARFGTHNNTTEPTGSSSTSGSFNRHSFSWAKGDTKWVTLSNSIGNEFRDGSTKGITTGRTGSGNRDDYGYFRGSDASSTTKPQIRITFTTDATADFEIWLAYIQFAYTKDAASTPVLMYLGLNSSGIQGSGVARGLSVANYDWGTSVTVPGDWRDSAYLDPTSGNRVTRLDNANRVLSGQYVRVYLENQFGYFDTSQDLRWVLNTTNQAEDASPPDTPEFHDFRSADTAGTDQDPHVVVVSMPRSRLDRTMGAQVQLSDGTHVYVEQSAEAPDDFNAVIKHHDGTSASTVFTQAMSGGKRGAQSVTIIRDDSDNLFLICRSTAITYGGSDRAVQNTIYGRMLRKGAGYTWTSVSEKSYLITEFWGDINSVAGAWHPVNTGGTIVLLVGHTSGRNNDAWIPNEVSYVLINCQHFVDSAGSLFRGLGTVTTTLLPNPSPPGFTNPYNGSGTLLDVVRTGNDRGFVASTLRDVVFGSSGSVGIGRYTLNSTGTTFTAARYTDSTVGLATKDATPKIKLLPITADRVVKVTADSRTGYGFVVHLLENIGSSSTITSQGSVRVDAAALATMPTPATLATSSAWDAIYSPIENRVWIYYFDAADGQRLMRTHVDLATMQAGGSQVEVNASVGATGSSNLAVRVQRGSTYGLQQLVSIANKTGAGVQSMIYVTDLITIAPDQPTLTPHANFNANFSTIFYWTFHHSSPLAVQGAYQLQIENVATSTTIYDSTKVTSATSNATLAASGIANGLDCRWRVKTWDGGDTEGPWSEYSTFSTSATGIVNITYPAIDNDPGIITSSVEVTWTVTGPYDHYQVKVYRTDTETLVFDTGSLASSVAVSYLITSLISGVEYRVEVSTTSAGIPGNTATRLITPDFAAPEAPIITATASNDDGYILLTIINPDPQGDRPNPDAVEIYRRELGDTGPFVKIGVTDPNSDYHDFTAASGTVYEYLAIAGVYPED